MAPTRKVRPDPVVITDAPQDPETELRRREIRYVAMMLTRAACVVGSAVIVVQKPPLWPLWAVLAAFLGGFMVSYSRARAESLGADCSLGFTQRPERYVILGGGSMFGTLAAHVACDPGVGRAALIVSLVVVAALANLTALQRVAFTVRQLS